MKELTIEEKAERFDEVLAMAKECITYVPDDAVNKYMLNMFPELKESEDEKWIPKEIAKYLKEKGGFRSCWLAWLEKQGDNPTPINIDKMVMEYSQTKDSDFGLPVNCMIRAYRQGIIDVLNLSLGIEKQGGITKLSEEEQNRFAKGVLSNCAMSFIDYLDTHNCEGKMCVSNGDCADIENAFHNDMWDKLHRYYCKYIEKQNEQNHANSTKTCEDVPKPDDKVEPKFHKDEWITNGDYTWKIVEVKPLDYILQSQDGNIVDDTISHVDEQFHSFTIEDAKDGDVLATDDWVFIFKKLNTDGKPVCYCHYDIELGFHIDVNTYISTGSYIRPATREQRDTLMKAMADSGYIFDFDKKELKRIKQKTAEEYNITGIHSKHAEGKLGEMIKNLKSVNEMKVEPKFKVKYAGSEYNVLEVKDIAGVTFYGIEDEPNHIDYVKAESCEIISGYGIKENGSPYPTKPAVFSEQKPAWSEENEDTIKFLISHFCVSHYNRSFQFTSNKLITHDELLEKIRNLRPQSTWKPSEEQMIALRQTISGCSYDVEPLLELEKQLKKL